MFFVWPDLICDFQEKAKDAKEFVRETQWVDVSSSWPGFVDFFLLGGKVGKFPFSGPRSHRFADKIEMFEMFLLFFFFSDAMFVSGGYIYVLRLNSGSML